MRKYLVAGPTEDAGMEVEADFFEITESGALIFTNEDDYTVQAFNEWAWESFVPLGEEE